jgi:hypothetical protein
LTVIYFGHEQRVPAMVVLLLAGAIAALAHTVSVR